MKNTIGTLVRSLSVRVIVMNARGCGNSDLITPQAYCGAYTGDVDAVVHHVRRRYPKSPLVGVGFSLGANILSKYVGEQANDCLLQAAIAVSNPWDLLNSSRSIDGSFFNRTFYSTALARNMCTLFKGAPHV